LKKVVTLSVALLALAFSLLACQVNGLVPGTPAPIPTPTSAAQITPIVAVDLTSQQDRLIALYQNVSLGTVTIKTNTALGSGWVYSSDGYVVTNAHVVGNQARVEVDFVDGTKVYGQVAGQDAYSDLAVIKVDLPASQLHPLVLGDSDTLQVGQIVVAIGNPFGYDETMTTGIVSAIGRSLPTGNQTVSGAYFSSGDIIQTDALLNHGNSGGPLLDLNGQVVGVNEAIQLDPTTGANSGIGYAISVNVVKRVIPSLIERGKYDYPYLGIAARDNLPLEAINALGLPRTSGAYVTDVTLNGPAAQAGIRAGTQPVNVPGYLGLMAGGDLIIAADGRSVLTFDDLVRYLAAHKSPGDTIVLTILRGDQQMDVTVTVGKRP
jgi:S1-C subfamily serine protease